MLPLSSFSEHDLSSISRARAPPGHKPALRITTRTNWLALHAQTSAILIWNSNLAARFERLLWAQERQWRFFGKFVAMLTDDITREYGVKVGKDWSVGRLTTGEIILTLESKS